MLEISQTAVKGALRRARASLDQHLPEVKRLGGVPTAGSPQESALAGRFAEALTAGDIESVIALLTDDAWLAMPPQSKHHLAAIARVAAPVGAHPRQHPTCIRVLSRA